MPQRTSTKDSSPGHRKALSPRSKCSFQTSLPRAGMEQSLLGAPQLTLGRCQESSRHAACPCAPLCTSLLLWAYCPGAPGALAVPQLVSSHKPSSPGHPWQPVTPHYHHQGHGLFQVGFLEREWGGSLAFKAPEVGALDEFSSFPQQCPSLSSLSPSPPPGTHPSEHKRQNLPRAGSSWVGNPITVQMNLQCITLSPHF